MFKTLQPSLSGVLEQQMRDSAGSLFFPNQERHDGVGVGTYLSSYLRSAFCHLRATRVLLLQVAQNHLSAQTFVGQLGVRVHQKMSREVEWIVARSEAHKAHVVAFNVAVVEIQVRDEQLALSIALVAEQIFAVLALDELLAVFRPRKQVLDSVCEVRRVLH